jgi:hypothetical protein
MNKRVIKGWRKFSTDEHTGKTVALKFDFTELLKVWK